MKELPTIYQSIIHLSRYSRYIESKQRRESWAETVDRLILFLKSRLDGVHLEEKHKNILEEIRNGVLNLEAMCSMRLLMTAGEAVERDNVAAFNCAYTEAGGSGASIKVLTKEMKAAGMDEPITIMMSEPKSFDEIMYILLCGTGMGFSCERQVIASLPVIGHKLSRRIYEATDANFKGVPKEEISRFSRKNNMIYVADSKYGWASALRILITELYNGNFTVSWDVSKIRPEGSPLKVFGGRASGPRPLSELFSYTRKLFKDNDGSKLTSVGVHDLVCKIAEVVVVGGVRRAALISLSNLSDDRMRHAKAGSWWIDNPERALANNSIAYTEKPDIETYMREMSALIESKSGERGIFSRPSAQAQASRWGRRDPSLRYGVNPCSEIILRSQQFCNLTEVVIRATDTYADVKRKVGLAAVVGTLQSTLTDFKYLGPEWKENTDIERLLGVSITGIMDHPFFSNSVKNMPDEWWGDEEHHRTHVTQHDYELPECLEMLRDHAREVNKEWAGILGIPESAAITCVKPSGTVSQLVDAASGIHARHNPHYIRRIRMDKKDPVYVFLKDRGVPVEDEARSPDTTAVFSFPMKAPDNAICRTDKTAIEQLETWLIYQRHWCEHKPSVTISVKDDEWPEVIAWVWKYFDEVSGISFLPFSDHTYTQAPYEDINQDQYEAMVAEMPTGIDFSDMIEVRDNTEGSQTLACSSSGGCDI